MQQIEQMYFEFADKRHKKCHTTIKCQLRTIYYHVIRKECYRMPGNTWK